MKLQVHESTGLHMYMKRHVHETTGVHMYMKLQVHESTGAQVSPMVYNYLLIHVRRRVVRWLVPPHSLLPFTHPISSQIPILPYFLSIMLSLIFQSQLPRASSLVFPFFSLNYLLQPNFLSISL